MPAFGLETLFPGLPSFGKNSLETMFPDLSTLKWSEKRYIYDNMLSLLYRWSYDDSVTEASISQEIAPLKFPVKVHSWNHVVISVQAGQEGNVSEGRVSVML